MNERVGIESFIKTFAFFRGHIVFVLCMAVVALSPSLMLSISGWQSIHRRDVWYILLSLLSFFWELIGTLAIISKANGWQSNAPLKTLPCFRQAIRTVMPAVRAFLLLALAVIPLLIIFFIITAIGRGISQSVLRSLPFILLTIIYWHFLLFMGFFILPLEIIHKRPASTALPESVSLSFKLYKAVLPLVCTLLFISILGSNLLFGAYTASNITFQSISGVVKIVSRVYALLLISEVRESPNKSLQLTA